MSPPHKMQNTDQSRTKHVHHTWRTIHKRIGHLRINKRVQLPICDLDIHFANNSTIEAFEL